MPQQLSAQNNLQSCNVQCPASTPLPALPSPHSFRLTLPPAPTRGACCCVCLQATRLSDFGTPGADLSGVHYLRNVADADSLLAGVETAKAAGGKVGGWNTLINV